MHHQSDVGQGGASDSDRQVAAGNENGRKKMTEKKVSVSCSAVSNGRQIMLDPLRMLNLSVPARQVESILPCGLSMEWATGEHDGSQFGVTVGAGLGSPWLTFCWRDKEYCVNVEDIIKAFFAEILKSESTTKTKKQRR
jgi:hypothetical protein